MRSLAPIYRQDLTRLGRLIRASREELFQRHPEWGERYRTAVLFSVLAGKAANHYGSGISGFDEFHLYTFYAESQARTFPRMGRECLDFGKSVHGRGEGVPEAFLGRRLWLEHRHMPNENASSALERLQSYLQGGRTPTARLLRQDSVVMVEPQPLLGVLAWPTLVTPSKYPNS